MKPKECCISYCTNIFYVSKEEFFQKDLCDECASNSNNKMDRLNKYCRNAITNYPHLRGQINDFYQLCLDEIEAGESKENEIELCIGSIEELIESGKKRMPDKKFNALLNKWKF